MAVRRITRPIRYAVVGLGHIAQVAILPAFAHAGRDSRLAALVSSDRTKLRHAAQRYGVEATYGYDRYEECLANVDAVYIALPNHLHAEYTVRAARAGVHVLCEKPMAVTPEECEAMIAACRKHRVKLMIAYRLHFEELTVAAIELVRRGRLGTPRFFTSAFSMNVRQGNIRTKQELGGGTLPDIGVYCINAARHLFRAEPNEVVAVSVHSGTAKLRDVDETTASILRFENGRVASFVTSFGSADVSEYRIVGTKGSLRADPAYEYAQGLSYVVDVGGRRTRWRVGRRDQFGPQIQYFSECVLKNRTPEPSGEEGLQDVRIVRALYESAETGKPVAIPPFARSQQPSRSQQRTKPAVRKPPLVKVKGAST